MRLIYVKSHLEWSEDSLCIYFAHEKTDHTESKPGNPRHIYANPYRPEICPIVSLGIYFLYVDVTNPEGQYIFARQKQGCRFDKVLIQWLPEGEQGQVNRGRGGRGGRGRGADGGSRGEELEQQASQLAGVSRRRYGTHSIRKGSSTYASSCTTSCPSYVSICNRAGWSLGIPGLYLQYEAAGDQYLGRTLAGLNGNDTSFAVLPPQFKEGYEDIVTRLVREHFSFYDSVGSVMQKVVRMTMASVVYHMDAIKLWNSCTELWKKPLFTRDYGVRLKDIVEVREWTAGDVRNVTGIPPHICTALETKRLRVAAEDILKTYVRSEGSSVIQGRGI